MTIQLPGGGTETIRYTGDVAPRVSFFDAPFGVAWSSPFTFGFGPSFVAFDQIAAALNRRMDALWRQAETMTNWRARGDLSEVTLESLGPGGSAYTVVSQSFGGQVCTRTTEITTSPNGGKSTVVSRTSGGVRSRL